MNLYKSFVKMLKNIFYIETRKKIFNTESDEEFMDARVFDGNPNGKYNFNKSPHKAIVNIYANMLARNWFPNEIDISKDKKEYGRLPDSYRRAYNLVLAQLITNDSIQSNQLADRINSIITSPMINAALIRQAWEEVNHSQSYSVMAEDVVQDSDMIFELDKTDIELSLKNKAVEKMYNSIYKGLWVTRRDKLLALVANQILEVMVFPGGFVTIYAMEDYMLGSAEMIKRIQRDESGTHEPLFKNIYRLAVRELYPNGIPIGLLDDATDMVTDMVKAEIRWLKYLTKGITAFNDDTIKAFVEARANKVFTNLKMLNLYESKGDDYLSTLLKDRDMSTDVDHRSNNFEVAGKQYVDGGVIYDLTSDKIYKPVKNKK